MFQEQDLHNWPVHSGETFDINGYERDFLRMLEDTTSLIG